MSFHCGFSRSEEHTSELQSLRHLVCRLLLEKKIKIPASGRNHAAEVQVLQRHTLDELLTDSAAVPQSGLPTHCRFATLLGFSFFFLKNPAPPQILLLPPPTPSRP